MKLLVLVFVVYKGCTSCFWRLARLSEDQDPGEIQEVRNSNVSEWTVKRRLHASALSLQQQHRIAKLTFARNHIHWNDDDWSRLLFSKESRFCLT